MAVRAVRGKRPPKRVLDQQTQSVRRASTDTDRDHGMGGPVLISQASRNRVVQPDKLFDDTSEILFRPCRQRHVKSTVGRYLVHQIVKALPKVRPRKVVF